MGNFWALSYAPYASVCHTHIGKTTEVLYSVSNIKDVIDGDAAYEQSALVFKSRKSEW